MRRHDAVFIKEIPLGTKNEDIINAFKSVKPIKIKFIRYNNDKFLGFAFAQFSTEEDRENAFQHNEFIHINQSKSKVLPARIIISQCFDYRRRNRRHAPKYFLIRPQNILANSKIDCSTVLSCNYFNH